MCIYKLIAYMHEVDELGHFRVIEYPPKELVINQYSDFRYHENPAIPYLDPSHEDRLNLIYETQQMKLTTLIGNISPHNNTVR